MKRVSCLSIPLVIHSGEFGAPRHQDTVITVYGASSRKHKDSAVKISGAVNGVESNGRTQYIKQHSYNDNTSKMRKPLWLTAADRTGEN